METSYEILEDAALLQCYGDLLNAVQVMRQEIEKRILERNALGIPDERYECSLPKRFTYDHTKFKPLLEILNRAELEDCWTAPWNEYVPAHTVQHPEAWDTIKALAVARQRGNEAMQIIEAARMEGRGSLTFKERKEVKK